MNIAIGAEVFIYDDWASLGSRLGVRNVFTTIERAGLGKRLGYIPSECVIRRLRVIRHFNIGAHGGNGYQSNCSYKSKESNY